MMCTENIKKLVFVYLPFIGFYILAIIAFAIVTTIMDTVLGGISIEFVNSNGGIIFSTIVYMVVEIFTYGLLLMYIMVSTAQFYNLAKVVPGEEADTEGLNVNVEEIDVNKPVTNGNLVKAISDFIRLREPENQELLYKELTHARLLVPAIIDGKISGSGATKTIEKDTTISFSTIKSRNGELYLLAFTDWVELRKWDENPNIKTFVLSVDDCNSIVNNSKNSLAGVSLNPMNENIFFKDTEIYFGRDNFAIQKNSEV